MDTKLQAAEMQFMLYSVVLQHCTEELGQPKKLCSNPMKVLLPGGNHGAGVNSGRSLRFLPDQDPESEFWTKTRFWVGAGVKVSVFTGAR